MLFSILSIESSVCEESSPYLENRTTLTVNSNVYQCFQIQNNALVIDDIVDITVYSSDGDAFICNGTGFGFNCRVNTSTDSYYLVIFKVDHSFSVIPNIFLYPTPQYLIAKPGEYRLTEYRSLIQPTISAATASLINGTLTDAYSHCISEFNYDSYNYIYSYRDQTALTQPSATYGYRKIYGYTSDCFLNITSSDTGWNNPIEGLVNLIEQKVLTQSDFISDSENLLSPYCGPNVVFPPILIQTQTFIFSSASLQCFIVTNNVIETTCLLEVAAIAMINRTALQPGASPFAPRLGFAPKVIVFHRD
jgi:hypothetical protein